eukprot:962913-Prorocentrum_minimum.AAC.11
MNRVQAPSTTPSAPPAAEGDPTEAAFIMHARNGQIGRLQLMCTLGALGSLTKLDPKRASHLTNEMLARSDTDGDGLISYPQFTKLYTEFVKAYGQPSPLPNAAECPKGTGPMPRRLRTRPREGRIRGKRGVGFRVRRVI